MKRFVLTAIVISSFVATNLHAQEHGKYGLTRASVELRSSYHYNSIDEKIDNNATGFKGNYFQFLLSGDISEKFHFDFRQKFNKYSADYSFFDATDKALLIYTPTDQLSVKLGKRPLTMGGCDYGIIPIDLYLTGQYCDLLTIYQWGISGVYTSKSGSDTFTFELTQSPFKNYSSNKNIYAYSGVWEGSHGIVDFLHSIHFYGTEEGKYVNSSQNSSRGLLTNKITTIFLGNGYIDKVMGLPFNLDDEENRELKAIKGYNKEYKKNLLFYFKSYSNQVKKTITKSKFMKMLRDKGINSERMDYEEVNLIIRRLFKENISEFNFNQFVNLLVQVSYLIYTKRRPTLTIGETYGILLKRFSLNNNAEKIALLKKKYEAVIDYLLELKEDNEPFNLPEGFKFMRKTSVKYNSRLAPHFMDYLGEGNFICYQVLEDILFHIFNSSIIEPYVEVSTEETVEIEPE